MSKGLHDLRMWRNQKADGGWPSKTPAKVKDSGNEVMDSLSKLTKKHHTGRMTRCDWLDRLTFREIELIYEREKRTSNYMYLMIEFPRMEYHDVEVRHFQQHSLKLIWDIKTVYLVMNCLATFIAVHSRVLREGRRRHCGQANSVWIHRSERRRDATGEPGGRKAPQAGAKRAQRFDGSGSETWRGDTRPAARNRRISPDEDSGFRGAGSCLALSLLPVEPEKSSHQVSQVCHLDVDVRGSPSSGLDVALGTYRSWGCARTAWARLHARYRQKIRHFPSSARHWRGT